jgi:hypothetical protein
MKNFPPGILIIPAGHFAGGAGDATAETEAEAVVTGSGAFFRKKTTPRPRPPRSTTPPTAASANARPLLPAFGIGAPCGRRYSL